MHRRAFFGTPAGALVAAPVVPALDEPLPAPRLGVLFRDRAGRLVWPAGAENWSDGQRLAAYAELADGEVKALQNAIDLYLR